MPLALFKESVYSLLNVFIQTINKYVKVKDYAIVKNRFKRFIKNVLIKIFVKYDAYNETNFVNNERHVTYN